jgi:hypothetical protein
MEEEGVHVSLRGGGGSRELYAGFWLGKQERKRPLGRPRHRWEDDIKVDLEEVGWEHDLLGLGIGTVGGLF